MGKNYGKNVQSSVSFCFTALNKFDLHLHDSSNLDCLPKKLAVLKLGWNDILLVFYYLILQESNSMNHIMEQGSFQNVSRTKELKLCKR